MSSGVSPGASCYRSLREDRREEPGSRCFPTLLIVPLAIFLAVPAAAQLPEVHLPPELAMVVRIREKMRKSLEELPNYTCQQRVERTRLNAEANRRGRQKIERHNGEGHRNAYMPLDSTDTLELEVAFIDGKELYSWPGADGFEDRPLSEIVGFGTVGTGDFAHHARALFIQKVGRLDSAGEEAIGDRRVVRYDFSVSLFMSGYSVSDGTNRATVPYAGSIWADAETADLARIEVRTEDVPPPLTITSTVTQVDYQSVTLGDGEFLLPASARLVTRFRSGGENVNATEFRDCRAFGANSELSFDIGGSGGATEAALTREEFELPAKVSMTVRLDTEINSEQSVVGDRIEATLTAAVERDGEILAPKGSSLIGRIRRLERFTDPRNHFVVGLEFTELRTPNRRALVKTELVHVTRFGGLVERFGEEKTTYQRQGGGLAGPGFERTTTESFSTTPIAGTSEVYIRANRFRMAAGLRMVWRTLARDP